VTSDSIAARAAVVYEAERLVLLKSVDVPAGTTWEVAAERGWVDRHFPQVVAELACPVEVVNFRRVLESLP
jgi:5-(aminomethyl)-3-furanmethanol phosphate kinase